MFTLIHKAKYLYSIKLAKSRFVNTDVSGNPKKNTRLQNKILAEIKFSSFYQTI